jgi:hypothetical protein
LTNLPYRFIIDMIVIKPLNERSSGMEHIQRTAGGGIAVVGLQVNGLARANRKW